MWAVIYLGKDMPAVMTRVYGPFETYDDALDCVQGLPPAIECETKYVTALMQMDANG